MSSRSDYLFNTERLYDFLLQRQRRMSEEVIAMNRDEILKMSEEDLCNYLVDRYSVQPPVMNVDAKEISDDRPIQVSRPSMWNDGRVFQVPAQLLVLSIPFEGDAQLFQLRPSSYSTRHCSAQVTHNEVQLRYEVTSNDKDRLENNINQDVGYLQSNVAQIQKDVAEYNHQLPSHVRQAVTSRKQLLLEQMNLVAGLNIPVRRRESASQTYAVPAIKRKPRIERPVVPKGSFQPEPAWPMEEYEHILSVIQNMSLVLERSPSAFANMNEEALRTHFLVQLNGHYDGATGETFNQSGKTDILIKEKDRNVFIAECKFWTGPGAFPECIDQLLGYTSWRDTKTAILLFNRNKDMSNVLEQIPGLVKAHPNFKQEKPGQMTDTQFRYLFHQNGDKNREFYLTVCVFNVPSS
ncbi:hypothetical protein [Paludisphaera borealis]|uniref:Uncharacterized protein n=1 Tax=Paludisphaera borealis TaxID=1387353 RepID=A0A1U7CZC3_9BACT|nr:hypothetical protein [Paludisphaera borealis]APW64312.1 hypothetical protein BSF38_20030 [Paludisphaera borealis]